MCGISGVLYSDAAKPVSPSLLRGLSNALAHRGPDAEGLWHEPGVGLAHRRLSIIDLEGGNQPISNEDGTVQVIFNGEIYNYRELRSDLEQRGHRFRTSSDTEVLVHLYEELGADLATRLRGMYAFALWDRRQRALLLVRDRIGIKPLYVYRDSEVLLFASEPKAFLAYPRVDLPIDLTALEQYVAFGMTCGSRSIFQNVEKLKPGHFLRVTAANLHETSKRYWTLQPAATLPQTVDEWKEAVQHKVKEAVRLTMIADVPVGAFLSGGIDSSVVVALASTLQPDPLRTFSIGFDDQSFSELPRARTVAVRYGTEHHEEIVTPDAVTLLDDITHFYDEPFADSSSIPTFLVSRMAARHVKVVLSGDGGDEAFGGYARYAQDLWEAAFRARLPGSVRRGPIAAASRLWPRADWLPRPLRLKTVLTNLSLPPGEAYANSLMGCREPVRRRLLSADVRARLSQERIDSPLVEAYSHNGTEVDALRAMIEADVAVTLPDDYLVKVDRASMANGLEVRPPLLDHELLELTIGMPSKLKIRGRRTKWLFKQAFADALPSEVITGPKHGFEIPLDSWLRQPLREVFESAVLARNAAVSDLIDQDYARELYRAHLAGTARNGQTLWTVLVLARWAERYLTGSVAVQ